MTAKAAARNFPSLRILRSSVSNISESFINESDGERCERFALDKDI
ncbi:hypothetical protein X759_32200 [Mesorhizobium sp. LSHC420B00]|nr:hypothetical protein X759_32200 [Mesorhizobium sp. LSHC420B00]